MRIGIQKPRPKLPRYKDIMKFITMNEKCKRIYVYRYWSKRIIIYFLNLSTHSPFVENNHCWNFCWFSDMNFFPVELFQQKWDKIENISSFYAPYFEGLDCKCNIGLSFKIQSDSKVQKNWNEILKYFKIQFITLMTLYYFTAYHL